MCYNLTPQNTRSAVFLWRIKLRESFGMQETFQAASILAAISVPLLTGIASVEVLASNIVLVRSVAIAGFLFLMAALWAFMELIEITKLPGMTVAAAFRGLFSSRGALLLGLICLLVFQIIQSRVLF
jgi:hypothetical protein